MTVFLFCGDRCVFTSVTITNSVQKMASLAGVEDLLFSVQESGLVRLAPDASHPIGLALVRMENNPDKFEAVQFNEGWGSLENFSLWLRDLKTACDSNPKAEFIARKGY